MGKTEFVAAAANPKADFALDTKGVIGILEIT